MRLNYFNNFGKGIEFDPDTESAYEILLSSPAEITNGIGSMLDNVCVALVVKSGKLFLYVGKAEFDLSDNATTLQYEHLANGSTRFAAHGKEGSKEIIYKSWWLAQAPGVAGLGAGSDEDEDFCAYVVFMLESETRKNHLIQKYS